jgi:hypothetical protein
LATSTTGELLAVALLTEEMSTNFVPRVLNRRKWDSMGRVHRNITALCWKDMRHTYLQERAMFGTDCGMF